MKIAFNSSLPRSGSTLLQNILAQNPGFYCSPTSGVLELLYGARDNFTKCSEFKSQNREEMDSAFSGFCRNGLLGYYGRYSNSRVIMDKSRGWMAYYDWLNTFYPNPKIIVCIRDPRAIFSSMEKLWRSNQNRQADGENPSKMQFLNVDQRVGFWMTSPPIGLALTRLEDAIQRGHGEHFKFIRFEDLSRDPMPVMEDVYDFLDEPYFTHDFENIKQSTTEDDSVHGIPDLHTIRPNLQPVDPDWNEILTKEVNRAIRTKYAWFYQRFYPNAT